MKRAARVRGTVATTCRCGQPWVSVHFGNSGTTEILRACPTVRAEWADVPTYTRGASVPGHEFVVTTKPTHAATGCCNIRHVDA